MDKSSALVTFEDYKSLEAHLRNRSCSAQRSTIEEIDAAIDKEINKFGRGLRRTLNF
jgi:hypothetical protein